jgi:hypothetical protein
LILDGRSSEKVEPQVIDFRKSLSKLQCNNITLGYSLQLSVQDSINEKSSRIAKG